MTDEFLAECMARGVAEVRLRVINMLPAPVPSKDAIFDFCFAAGDRGRTRVFTVHLADFGARFMERALLVSIQELEHLGLPPFVAFP